MSTGTDHRPEVWVAELRAAGWVKYRGMMFVWQSPSGLLFRGPFKAWEMMKRYPELNSKKAKKAIQ